MATAAVIASPPLAETMEHTDALDHFPLALAFNAINNAAQIALAVSLRVELADYSREAMSLDMRRVAELFHQAEAYMAEGQQLLAQLTRLTEQQQNDLRVMAAESVIAAREVTAARTQRARTVALVESMEKVAYHRLEAATGEAHALQAIYAELVPTLRPMGASPQEPRRAAVGA